MVDTSDHTPTTGFRASVVIPARNAAETLEEAVAAALRDPATTEVVVAVGPSSDATREVADRLAADPRVRPVDNPSGRTPDALNAAIAAASGDVLVRVDSHAVVPEGYVTRALETLAATGAANVGGRQVPTAPSGFAAAVAAAMRSPFGAGGATYRTGTEPGPADTVYLGVFRREALEEVGGFDPVMERNQDAELNARLRAAGHVVWFDPELEVRYRPRDRAGALARQYWGYGRWRRATVGRHPASLQARQLAAPVLVVALAGSLLAGLAMREWRVPAIVWGAYLLGAVVAGGIAAPRPRLAPATSLALVTMHLAWGTGFLVGPPRSARRARAGRVAPTAEARDG